MLARVLSSAVVGIEAFLVEVEVDVANGLPAFTIVGLPDAACRESAERVRSALKNSGFTFPAKRVTVNLAPADIRKAGSAYDLAIAIGVLAAEEVLPHASLEGKMFCAELSLGGRLRAVTGVLPRAASEWARDGKVELVIPQANLREAAFVEGSRILPARTFADLVRHLSGEAEIETVEGKGVGPAPPRSADAADFSEIRGQQHAKRGLEIAAAGGHNVLMIGPPGSGKTMLAKRMPTILSKMTTVEALETTKIHSVAGLLRGRTRILETRPFRDPHHTISNVAMVGGGTHPKPGEVSLSHHGVLFLDELAEFRRDVLEVLRQPIEEGHVSIGRAATTLTFPSRFMLVAAMNPCPCGYYTDPKKECQCSSLQIRSYLSKVSGPLLDRIDIQLEVPRLKPGDLFSPPAGETSETIRERVDRARERQYARYGAGQVNASLGTAQIETACRLDDEGLALIRQAVDRMGFSARAYHKSLKVARTIADLEGEEAILPRHVAEAVHYRVLDKNSN